MEWWLVLLFIFGSLLAIMATGLPVAFCFLFIDILGVLIFWGGVNGLSQLILSLYSSIGTFALLPVPMFILMGEVMFQSGLGNSMVDAVDKWLGRLPGRLGLLAVASATIFSTTSGSTIATTAMLGSMLTPEMEKRGYKKSMSIGPVMGSGGLAMLIPPSGLAVILASVAEISIGKLLIAGIIPGLVIASLYVGYIVGRSFLQPSLAPAYNISRVSFSEKLLATLKYVCPLGFIIFLVIGVIFLGIATPTEAAAMGAIGTFMLTAFYRRLKWEIVRKSIVATVRITVMTLMIISGAIAFSQILAFSGASRGLLEFTVGLPVPPLVIFIVMQIVLLFLGTFMSGPAIMMISIPIFYPIVYAMGWDPVWFGLVMLINLEMSQSTPPFGMLIFVMKGVAPPDTTLADIIKSGIPFIICDLLTIILLVAFPMLALWLPGFMR